MELVRFDDPGRFLALVGPSLRLDEARNQLVLGIAANAVAGYPGFSPFHGWVVVETEPAAAAARTPPRNVVLAEPADDDALMALVDAIIGDMPDVPGVVGNVPAVDRFARRWSAATGVRPATVLRQGVLALERVIRPVRPLGIGEPAARSDVDGLVRWWLAFAAEAHPYEKAEADAAEEARRIIEARLAGDTSGVWVWRVDGRPVSMSAFGGPTGSGIRIGPVYTPPEHRRRGYASALVADLSASLLADGYDRCMLYTDLANPTSNRIYETIGYRKVAESKVMTFER